MLRKNDGSLQGSVGIEFDTVVRNTHTHGQLISTTKVLRRIEIQASEWQWKDSCNSNLYLISFQGQSRDSKRIDLPL